MTNIIKKKRRKNFSQDVQSNTFPVKFSFLRLYAYMVYYDETFLVNSSVTIITSWVIQERSGL